MSTSRSIVLGVLPCVADPDSIDQDHRVSILDLDLTHPPAGTNSLRFDVLGGGGPQQFSVKNDQSWSDPTIWEDLRPGSTVAYQQESNVYIADPKNAPGNFQIQISAVVPNGTYPLENWLGDLGERVASVRLNDLPMTGAHDAGTFGIGRNSPKGADGSALLPSPAGGFVSSAKAQGWSWEQMLLAGVRYFDIRLTTYAGEDGQLGGYYLTHSWIGERMDAMLDAFADFLASHPAEVLVLDFQHQFGFSAADHDQVGNAIASKLGPWLASRQTFGPTSTVGSMQAADARAVVVYAQSGDGTPPPPSFFDTFPWAWKRDVDLRSVWGDQSTLDGLLQFLNTEIDNKPAEQLWVLQCQVTMPWDDGLDLEDAARDVNPAIHDWLADDEADVLVNMVMVDWVGFGDLPALTTKRAAALGS